MRDHIAGLWAAFDDALTPNELSWFDNPLKLKIPPEYRGPKSPLSGYPDG